MKKGSFKLVGLYFLLIHNASMAQEQEIQQLFLNIEKLKQFKEIFVDMSNTYEVLFRSYKAVNEISREKFMLHKTFLDGKLEVGPLVLEDKRIKYIMTDQIHLERICSKAINQIERGARFSYREIDYCKRICRNLIVASYRDFEELQLVLASHCLRMTEGERLELIDSIHFAICEKLHIALEFYEFLRQLSQQRKLAFRNLWGL